MNLHKILKPLILLVLVIGTVNGQSNSVKRFSKDWKKAGPEKNWNSTEHDYFFKWRNNLIEKRSRLLFGFVIKMYHFYQLIE